MKNPLNRRLTRELKGELGKYLVILILLIATIGFVSGFLVADGSMLTAYNESFEKYNIEDGHFTVVKQMNKAKKKHVESLGITLYDLFYVEETLVTNDSTLRIFPDRKDVDKVCLMEGSMPEKSDEIAIDRMYADNNSLKVGDVIASTDHSWRVTGLVALPDYSALFSDNNDSMFDAIKFGVAIVAEEGFAQLDQSKMTWQYAWKYNQSPKNNIEEKEMSDDLMSDINSTIVLDSYTPRYLNQAINFTGEDMGSDRGMMIVLLYMVIVIMAFVFSVIISNTISKEANVIRLYEKRVGAALYDSADFCHFDRCRYRQYFGIHCFERCLCGHVLRQLQFADLCYIVELGSLCIDHHCASGADGSHHLRGIILQTDTFTAEVSET